MASQIVSYPFEHGCGHVYRRHVQFYDPAKRKFRDILNPEHLEAQGAPPTMIARAKLELAQGMPGSEAYWREHVCLPCYQRGLPVKEAM